MAARILEKVALADKVWRYRLEAPRIAKKRKAGQFIILRATEDGERVPLTIANADPQQGWIDIIFQVVGKATTVLGSLSEGGSVPDLVGPLGRPTHIENFGRCVCIGGGVGIAPLYPIVKALKEAGNSVTTILAGRDKSLIILSDEVSKVSDRILFATDNGSFGRKGFALDVLKDLLSQGETFDFAVIIGPVPMMKFTSKVAVEAGIKTMASLNPIMIDGTGMCGGCRVSVGDQTKFACVDGPEFDAGLVDWDGLIARLTNYREHEKKVLDDHVCRLEGAQ